MPARALNSVVLPVLGLPTRATRGVRTAIMTKPESWQQSDAYAGGLVATETQSIIAEANLHGVAQRGETDNLELFALQKSHLHQPLNENVFAHHFLHGG